MGQQWSFQYRLWLVPMVMGLHCLEEFALDFNHWAVGALNIQSNWLEFNMINFAFTAYMVGAAVVGWRMPILALGSAALIGINAVVFHLGASIVTGTYSPGTASGLFLFVPATVYAYQGAYKDGILNLRVFFGSIGIGTLLHVYPLAILLARGFVHG